MAKLPARGLIEIIEIKQRGRHNEIILFGLRQVDDVLQTSHFVFPLVVYIGLLFDEQV
jgi:hypothetical protein